MKFSLILFAAVFVFAGCSQKSGEGNLKTAEENLKNNKIEEAIADYEGFIKDNPENVKAPEALTKLASIYQSKMLKTIPDSESLERAANIYRQVFDRYPKSTQAPTSLFMSSFILANELRNYNAAEISYKLFLQEYPDHELSNSAHEELNNLGLSPEEILKKKNAPNT